MTFYQFNQNNSGGTFLAPAIQVFIEASSPEEADMIALNNGLYFDGEGGVYEHDCSCCGPRWRKAKDSDPTHYPEDTEIPLQTVYYDDWASEDKVPVRKIIRKDWHVRD